jgi:hypothetical protein
MARLQAAVEEARTRAAEAETLQVYKRGSRGGLEGF